MNCATVLAHLSDFLDGELDEVLTEQMRAHVASCHDCRIVLDTTNQTITLLREHGRRVIPARERGRLFEELQQLLARGAS